MKYTYGDGVEKKKSLAMPLAFFAALIVGIYGYVNFQAPAILAVLEPADATASRLAALQPKSGQNLLYIPKINLETSISATTGDEGDALARGAVHRAPLSGDPKQGGNFVVAAHRLSLAINPIKTGVRSAFYHIDKVENGDEVYVDFDGVRYAYRVEKSAKSSEAKPVLEEKTPEPRLTLYSVESKNGTHDVVVARLVGQIVWVDGEPKLKSTNMTSSL